MIVESKSELQYNSKFIIILLSFFSLYGINTFLRSQVHQWPIPHLLILIQQMTLSTPPSLSISFIQVVNLTIQPIVAKLNKDNLLLLKKKIYIAIHGSRLEGFTLGVLHCPPHFFSYLNALVGSSQAILNLQYELQEYKDMLIIFWFLISIFLSVLPKLIKCFVSHDMGLL